MAVFEITEPVSDDVDPGGEQAGGDPGRYEHHPYLAVVQQLDDLAHEPSPLRQSADA